MSTLFARCSLALVTMTSLHRPCDAEASPERSRDAGRSWRPGMYSTVVREAPRFDRRKPVPTGKGAEFTFGDV